MERGSRTERRAAERDLVDPVLVEAVRSRSAGGRRRRLGCPRGRHRDAHAPRRAGHALRRPVRGLARRWDPGGTRRARPHTELRARRLLLAGDYPNFDDWTSPRATSSTPGPRPGSSPASTISWRPSSSRSAGRATSARHRTTAHELRTVRFSYPTDASHRPTLDSAGRTRAFRQVGVSGFAPVRARTDEDRDATAKAGRSVERPDVSAGGSARLGYAEKPLARRASRRASTSTAGEPRGPRGPRPARRGGGWWSRPEIASIEMPAASTPASTPASTSRWAGALPLGGCAATSLSPERGRYSPRGHRQRRWSRFGAATVRPFHGSRDRPDRARLPPTRRCRSLLPGTGWQGLHHAIPASSRRAPSSSRAALRVGPLRVVGTPTSTHRRPHRALPDGLDFSSPNRGRPDPRIEEKVELRLRPVLGRATATPCAARAWTTAPASTASPGDVRRRCARTLSARGPGCAARFTGTWTRPAGFAEAPGYALLDAARGAPRAGQLSVLAQPPRRGLPGARSRCRPRSGITASSR